MKTALYRKKWLQLITRYIKLLSGKFEKINYKLIQKFYCTQKNIFITIEKYENKNIS